jgi:hypothetical protein
LRQVSTFPPPILRLPAEDDGVQVHAEHDPDPADHLVPIFADLRVGSMRRSTRRACRCQSALNQLRRAQIEFVLQLPAKLIALKADTPSETDGWFSLSTGSQTDILDFAGLFTKLGIPPRRIEALGC